QNAAAVLDFQRNAAAAGDEVSKLTVQLAAEQDKLAHMKSQANVLVSNGSLSQVDADAGVSSQQSRVDDTSSRLSVARQMRDALNVEAEGHR
ncbi:hypothetical protein, partial [Gluconobacter sp. Gdi]|uniref:hypothetical protein n=1 Tax=Gluconobacter sp. Gdi TaxID=2691888 RepID=UPI00192202D5